jgi:hypothetical protein
MSVDTHSGISKLFRSPFVGNLIEFKRYLQSTTLEYLDEPLDDDMEWRIHDTISRIWGLMSRSSTPTDVFAFGIEVEDISDAKYVLLRIETVSSEGVRAVAYMLFRLRDIE